MKKWAWLTVVLSVLVLVLVGLLHILSPEFDPSWHMVSEYALGHYGWVLSLMFLTWGASSWTLAVTLWRQVTTKSGKAGLYFLIAAGVGEVMGAVFDINHDIGHGIAGLLGMAGLPVAALLITRGLESKQDWAKAKTLMNWLAHLTWVCVVLLIASLAIMTLQFARVNGGHLPQHAPATLPAGVVALSGWANRLSVLANCLWVGFIGWHTTRMAGSVNSAK
jgi:hypothetical protein